MSDILRAKVVSILDNQRLVINAGLEQNIHAGDEFYIYEEGDEIIDPESSQPLGKLEIVKAHLEAYLVQEKMSVLLPIGSGQQGSSSSVLSATLAQIRPTGSSQFPDRVTLNIRQDQIHGHKQLTQIAVGDKVRSVLPIE